jgi:uncharacterized membrane protein YeaQ/YmgE (transglycosylase-associated protein family)
MGMLLWIVIGIVAGSVAKLVMPGPNAGGMAVAIPLGIGGACIGGLLGAVFNGTAVIAFEPLSFLAALSGALFVLLSYRSYAMRATA